jgi:hypothetical protein
VRFSVTTKDGKVHLGILSQVTESEITVADSFGKESTFSKKEISIVAHITDKPLSETEEFHWEELTMLRIFDPQLYPRLFHIGDTMPVRLYDSAVLEDNSPVMCK